MFAFGLNRVFAGLLRWRFFLSGLHVWRQQSFFQFFYNFGRTLFFVGCASVQERGFCWAKLVGSLLIKLRRGRRFKLALLGCDSQLEAGLV